MKKNTRLASALLAVSLLACGTDSEDWAREEKWIRDHLGWTLIDEAGITAIESDSSNSRMTFEYTTSSTEPAALLHEILRRGEPLGWKGVAGSRVAFLVGRFPSNEYKDTEMELTVRVFDETLFPPGARHLARRERSLPFVHVTYRAGQPLWKELSEG